ELSHGGYGDGYFARQRHQSGRQGLVRGEAPRPRPCLPDQGRERTRREGIDDHQRRVRVRDDGSPGAAGGDYRRRRSSVRARIAEAIMRNRLTAFSTGVAPSRMRPYIITVNGVSAPTSISVVLKSENDMRKEMAADPSSAGRRYGSRMVRNTAALEAPRFSAASSRVRSKRLRLALMVSVAMVAM